MPDDRSITQRTLDTLREEWTREIAAERDQARDEAEMWRRERARLSDSYHRVHDAWDDARAEVERLRAALARIENATAASGNDAGLMRTIAYQALRAPSTEGRGGDDSPHAA